MSSMKPSCNLPIAGLQKTTLMDFPGCLAAIVFTPGCNYDCFYCHNREVLARPPLLAMEEVMAFLTRRQGLLEGVVVSGGEPTLHPALPDFFRMLRAMGYKTKLDTNGSAPQVLRRLMDDGLVDYVAVDLKAPLLRYPEICAHDASGLEETVALLGAFPISWELRTTVIPQLTLEDLQAMAPLAARAPAWFLQGYNVPPRYKPEDRFRIEAQPYSARQLEGLAQSLRSIAPHVQVRG